VDFFIEATKKGSLLHIILTAKSSSFSDDIVSEPEGSDDELTDIAVVFSLIIKRRLCK
jgi:hypothetical protein